MSTLPVLCPALFVLFLVTGVSPVVAQMAEPVSLTQVAPASLRLRVASPDYARGYVQVVRLSTQQPLFRETYTAPTYGQRFDFDRAPSGRYQVDLQVGLARYHYSVHVRTHAGRSTAWVRKLVVEYEPALVVATR
ncbi:hypothetical protein [Hymenobacter volaticus]|uniref:Uncharacterized protein n=1 Tax=Hymenobacter volaticus TaxID=2932254 RepID=A0ABY4GE67_9BACT|nr:hypothetical protein [Hymenobacter volaticus]UOQ69220.1 hypothetical protein MUN86_27590 [Hymenobacter volaticus]